MPEYEISAGESLEHNVPEDETVVNVTYNGDTEIVETEKDDYSNLMEKLKDMDRHQLYNYAQDNGVDVSWTGEDADTEYEMRGKIMNEIGGEDE